jgi:hypothetical protein
MAKKTFPCWVCRGQGYFHEDVLEYGQGPDYDCGYCEGEGLIEIGGAIHRKHFAEKLAMDILHFKRDDPKYNTDGYSFEELQVMGEKALNSI